MMLGGGAYTSQRLAGHGRGAECGAASGFAHAAARTSGCRRRKSRRPDPIRLTLLRSTPCSLRNLPCLGRNPGASPQRGPERRDLASAVAAAGASSIFRPGAGSAAADAAALGTASPGASEPRDRLADWNDVTDFCGDARRACRRRRASISTTALSVSTSRSMSPFLTGSPSCFSQDTSLPVSWAISSAGITTLSRHQRFAPAPDGWLSRLRPARLSRSFP